MDVVTFLGRELLEVSNLQLEYLDLLLQAPDVVLLAGGGGGGHPHVEATTLTHNTTSQFFKVISYTMIRFFQDGSYFF
jgi:hypothetical protein